MKPTLLIMAAGMGSRFGGLKQITPVGPENATLLDYSIYDALKAGFGKVVFIIRHDIEEDFRKAIGQKWEKKIEVDYVFQELSMVPGGFTVPPTRQKPWGTGHAIWVARALVREPFTVINADDYYGRNSYEVLLRGLQDVKDSKKTDYFMVGFQLKNTLSENGTVSRGICEVNPEGYLLKVVERLKIAKDGDKAKCLDEGIETSLLTGLETASMNMWGFTPEIFHQLEDLFEKFLAQKGQEEKSEFLIPRVVDQLLAEKKTTVKVLATKDPWFGITYPEDKAAVCESIGKLVRDGFYPDKLWA
jgi:UTP-glucose-1-phosphate uridylyltransferase